MTRWNRAADGCVAAVWLELGAPQSGELGHDGVNRIIFREDRWCAPIDCDRWCGPREECPGGEECYDPRAAAITTLCYDTGTGAILDADIEINGVDWAISSAGRSSGAGPLADLDNTFTHELGHFLGLDHTCWSDPLKPQPFDEDGDPVPSCDAPDLPPEITEATMFAFQDPGETKKASLEEDDVDGMCAIYRRAPDDCSCRTGGGSGGLVVGALALLALRSRRCRRP